MTRDAGPLDMYTTKEVDAVINTLLELRFSLIRTTDSQDGVGEQSAGASRKALQTLFMDLRPAEMKAAWSSARRLAADLASMRTALESLDADTALLVDNERLKEENRMSYTKLRANKIRCKLQLLHQKKYAELIESVEDPRSELETELNSLKKQLSEYAQRIKSKISQNEELMAMNREQGAELDAEREHVELLQGEKDGIHQEYTQRLQTKEVDHREVIAENERMTVQIQELETRIKELQDVNKKSMEQNNLQKSMANQERSRMLKQIEDMEKTESECTRLRADIIALNKEWCADREDLKSMMKEVIASNAKVDALELLVKDLESAKKQLSRKYTEKIWLIEDLHEEQCLEYQDDIESLGSKLMEEIDQIHKSLTERRQNGELIGPESTWQMMKTSESKGSSINIRSEQEIFV